MASNTNKRNKPIIIKRKPLTVIRITKINFPYLPKTNFPRESCETAARLLCKIFSMFPRSASRNRCIALLMRCLPCLLNVCVCVSRSQSQAGPWCLARTTRLDASLFQGNTAWPTRLAHSAFSSRCAFCLVRYIMEQ